MAARSTNDYDSPWKDALAQYFEPALALLVPGLHALIDGSRPISFLDKELQALSPHLAGGRLIADKLARAATRRHRHQSPQDRLLPKIELARLPYLYRYARNDVPCSLRLADGILGLPPELEADFTRALAIIENEHRMPYIMSVERLAMERCRAKGLAEGRAQGHAQGRAQGQALGRREAFQGVLQQ